MTVRPERPKTENEKLVPVILVLSLVAAVALFAFWMWFSSVGGAWLNDQMHRAFPH